MRSCDERVSRQGVSAVIGLLVSRLILPALVLSGCVSGQISERGIKGVVGGMRYEGCVRVAGEQVQRVGDWVYWYPNGQKVCEERFVDGLRHGVARSWHPGGTPASEGMWIYGNPAGTWIFWDERGMRTSVDMNRVSLESISSGRKEGDGQACSSRFVLPAQRVGRVDPSDLRTAL